MATEALVICLLDIMPSTGASPDLLGQFLSSADTASSEELLSRLMAEVADPVVSRAVHTRISGADADDVRQDVLADLIVRLREWKESGGGEEIKDFRAYAAVASRNGCDEYFRRMFPLRYRLQKRLRYLLAKDPRFALWEKPGGRLIGGRNEWCPLPRAERTDRREPAWESSRQTAAMVEAILDEAGAPLDFDDLVDRFASRAGIADGIEEPGAEPATPAGALTAMEHRGWLSRLWKEVIELPVRQRSALLLNLRDDGGGSALALLPITGVATMREIAAALELAAEELARIWKELPWDDQRIGTLLSVTRKQVGSLRKAARERLERRMR